MFAKVHKKCWCIYSTTLTLTLTHALHLLHQHVFEYIQMCVCECIAFPSLFLNSPFEMKVTKELHLLSLGQRVCILLYAYESDGKNILSFKDCE